MKAGDAKIETLQFKVTEQEGSFIEKCAAEEGRRLQVCRWGGLNEYGDGWQS
jgi:hypothetical protein